MSSLVTTIFHVMTCGVAVRGKEERGKSQLVEKDKDKLYLTGLKSESTQGRSAMKMNEKEWGQGKVATTTLGLGWKEGENGADRWIREKAPRQHLPWCLKRMDRLRGGRCSPCPSVHFSCYPCWHGLFFARSHHHHHRLLLSKSPSSLRKKRSTEPGRQL